MKDIVKRLNGFANWHTSCNGGNVSEEAQTCYDAVGRIKELEEALEGFIYAYGINNGDSPEIFKDAMLKRCGFALSVLRQDKSAPPASPDYQKRR